MTATSIVRLTLQERAAKALAEEEAAQKADYQRRAVEEREQRVARLSAAISATLQIDVPERDIIVESDDSGFPILVYAEVDGVRITQPASRERYGPRLYAALPCRTEGCDGRVLEDVDRLADLAVHLQSHAEGSGRVCYACEERAEEARQASRVPLIAPTPDNYIDSLREAGDDLAKATAEVQRLADGRGKAKSAAIQRLKEQTNPETGNKHSASSAKEVVETDPEYAAHRKAESDAEVERIRAEAHYKAVQLKARLAVGLAVKDNA